MRPNSKRPNNKADGSHPWIPHFLLQIPKKPCNDSHLLASYINEQKSYGYRSDCRIARAVKVYPCIRGSDCIGMMCDPNIEEGPGSIRKILHEAPALSARFRPSSISAPES